MLSNTAAHYKRLLERVDIAATPLFITAMLLVAFGRIVVSDTQVSWDEELYFQIARGWQHGLIPYRDLFDHKPPMVYVFFMLTSWSGHLAIVRLLVAFMLIWGVLQMFISLRSTGVITRQQLIFLVPALCYLLSCDAAAGTNTELIYAPLILLSYGSLLQGRIYPSAVYATAALTIKYTVLVDICGFAFVYWITNPARQASTRSLTIWALLVISMTVAVYGAFYVYFRMKGVDLIDQIVLRNVEHASLGRASPFAVDSGLRKFLIIAIATTFFVGLPCLYRIKNPRLFIGASLWLLLCLAQGCITGQYYAHYFYPAFLPLALIWASLDLPELYVAPLLFFLIALQSIQVVNNYIWLRGYERAAAAYRQVCAPLNSGGYIFTTFLAGYRVCKTSVLDKFMFPSFYVNDHFVKVSGSGGIKALRAKLRDGRLTAVIATELTARKLEDPLGPAQSIIHVVSDTAADREWAPKVLAMGNK